MATTLAERMNKFSGSPTSALIAKVAELKRQGKDIISLNVGEPDFGTPDYIKVAGMKAIADNFTKYTPGNGILELRQEIVKKLREDNGVEYALNEVTTAVGAKQAIASAMMVLAGPGDEVLLPIPCWVSYTEMIRLAGATPVFVRCGRTTMSWIWTPSRRPSPPGPRPSSSAPPTTPQGQYTVRRA